MHNCTCNHWNIIVTYQSGHDIMGVNYTLYLEVQILCIRHSATVKVVATDPN